MNDTPETHIRIATINYDQLLEAVWETQALLLTLLNDTNSARVQDVAARLKAIKDSAYPTIVWK